MRSHPREKIGRNDPCPCGSGRKYKHCCLSSEPVSNDTPWSRQREASDRLIDEIMKFAARRFGEQFEEAWKDFNQQDNPTPIGERPGEHQIFFPYFLFDWNPDQPSARRGQRVKPGIVAQEYLLERASQLPELERLMLEQSITQPVSFYEVVRCNPGHGMALRDALIGGEVEVEEHSASRSTRPGDLIYAQLCRLPDVTTLNRTAPISIPPDKKVEIVALRAQLRRKIAKQNRDLAPEDLIRHRELIRTAYLEIRDRLRTPPKLANTDGEPLVLHTITFQIGSAQVAFDALASLAWGASKEDLLNSAVWDRTGALQSVEIPWTVKGNRMHKSWENTILGHLRISGRSLVVEVNSVNRAKKIREQVEKRLGILATHLSTSVETPEEALAKRREHHKSALPEAEPEAESLDPGLQLLAEAEMQKYFEQWVHEKIPALGGRTPLQAVNDPEGKELVEALLLGWERHFEKSGGPGTIHPDFKAVHRLLKL